MAAELKNMGEFIRGVNDCCTIAADEFYAEHGVDPMKEFRGKYTSLKSAMRLVNSIGGVEGYIDSAIGFAWQRGGDRIALLEMDGATCIATSSGSFWRVFGESGMVLLNKNAVTPIATWGPHNGT